MRARTTALLLGTSLALAPGSSEAGKTVLSIDDPRWDDHGRGSYLYPSDSILYPRGSFDLLKFEVEVDETWVVFKATLAKKVVPPPAVKRTNASNLKLENQIYVQNIDIYIDTDPTTGQGFVDGIPGRNVTIEPDHAWDVAVVITPQPFQARSILNDWDPVRRALFPANVQSLGYTVTARIPMHELGDFPKPYWGYQVMVSGATWVPTFDVINRFALDLPINAFTMPVTTVVERGKFGGGELSFYHPNVIDILSPEGTTQERLLNASDADAKKYAVVPLVYPNPDAFIAERKKRQADLDAIPEVPEAQGKSAFFELRVKDVQGELVILEKSGSVELEQYRLGSVHNAKGTEVGRVVVTSVYPGFVVTTAVEGKKNIKVGSIVRFQKNSKEKP